MRDDPLKLVHRSAVATTGLTFILIVAGGLVTSRDAGLAVPDWPLSFGTLNPPRWYMIENVRTEHGHRLIAGLVSIATALTAFLVHRNEPRRWVRRFGTGALALVLLQALLGGLRVLNLSVDLAMIHACLAQLFFTTMIILTTATSPGWTRLVETATSSKRLRLHSTVACAAVFLQLLLGIALRHGSGSTGSLLHVPMFYLHMFGAMLVGWLCLTLPTVVADEGSGRASSSLETPARWVSYLVMLQVGLGLATLGVTNAMSFDRQATSLESWLPTLHVAAGALILGSSCGVATVSWFARAEQKTPLPVQQPSMAGNR